MDGGLKDLTCFSGVKKEGLCLEAFVMIAEVKI